MAGRKHHHVPQFLQRRFGIRSGAATQVFVYRRGVAPFKTSTTNYGAERDFYADGKDFFTDDLITKYECDIQDFFYRLETGDKNALQETTTISELLAHLELRTAFLRSQMFEVSGLMTEFFDSIFQSEATLVKAMSRYVRSNPKILRELIVDNFEPDAPIEAIADFALPQLESIFLKNSNVVFEAFSSQSEELRKTFFSAVKSSHLNILQRDFSEVERTKFYTGFKYSILKLESGSFILPDTMVAFCTKDKATPFNQERNKTIEVMLPISSKTMLYGRKDLKRSRDETELNSVLASTSFQSFIAVEDSPFFRKISSKIGRNANIFGKDEAKRVFNDFLADFASRRKIGRS